MADEAHKGKVALDNKDYPAAIAHLNTALKSSQSPVWLIQRSTAYQRNNQHELALADADNAVLAARSRGKRELIATAHFRRAVALHGLGRYGDARLCLHWCKKYNEKEKALTIWIARVKQDYDNSGGEAAECNQTTVKEIPEEVKEEKNVKPVVEDKGKGKALVTGAPVQTPKETVRQEWYQSPNTVTVEIFAKGIPKENAEVKIEEGSLEVSFPIASSYSTYDFIASPLFSPIDKAKSSFRITPHKIEIILQKSLPGLKWSSLEGTEAIQSSTPATSSEPIPASILKGNKPPAYPTSSLKGPKNWDTVGQDDEKEDDAADPEDFFKQLYKGASPDARRAMMKSYQESGGTALSMDWDDVSKRTMEVSPPDGMEAKKW